MSFTNMKKQRAAAMSKLLSSAKNAGGGNDSKSYKDERLWKPSVDSSGNGYAVIRFLPAAEGEDNPWIQYWDHGFQGPTGRWYIERSLTSLGQQDPVSELNSTLWATGDDENKSIVRKRKRRLHYVSNIMVVEDPKNPQNEGRVFLYQYGKKIFDKLLDAMQPEFADETPMNPFDFWEGADFKLKIRKVEGWQNYDKSEFARMRSVSDDDAVLEKLYGKIHSLAEYNDASNYKTYAELKTKLNQVLGEEGMVLSTAEHVSLDESLEAAPMKSSAPQPAAVVSKPSVDDDDDTLSYFNKLAADD